MTWTYCLSVDAWNTKSHGTSSRLPSTLGIDEKEFPPGDLGTTSLPSFTPFSSFPLRKPPLTQQREERRSIVVLPLPPRLSPFVPTKRALVMGRLLPFICLAHCTAYCEAVISVKNKFVGANKAASCGATKHNMATHRGTRCSNCHLIQREAGKSV